MQTVDKPQRGRPSSAKNGPSVKLQLSPKTQGQYITLDPEAQIAFEWVFETKESSVFAFDELYDEPRCSCGKSARYLIKVDTRQHHVCEDCYDATLVVVKAGMAAQLRLDPLIAALEKIVANRGFAGI